MSDLHIANISTQDHDFVFSLPENKRHHMRKIPAGGQIVLKDISPEAAKAIIDHHATYGMRDVAKISREKAYAGLCYSEKPIKYEGIADAIEHNMNQLEEEGKRLRDQAAVAADQSLIQNAPDTSELKSSIVEMKELEAKKEAKTSTEINEVRTVKPQPAEQVDRRGKRTAPPIQ